MHLHVPLCPLAHASTRQACGVPEPQPPRPRPHPHTQVPPADLVHLAAAVEQYSEHPAAVAILNFADSYLGLIQGSAQQAQQQQGGLGGSVVLGLGPKAQQGRKVEQELARLPAGGRGGVGMEDLAGDLQPLLSRGADGVVTVTTSSSTGSSRKAAAPRIPAKDVEVVVGQGICGWVPLDAGLLAAPSALAALQLEEGPGAQRVQRAQQAARSAQRAQQGQQPLEVKVVVGNKRMMADNGVAIPQAAEAYMRDMEVCLRGRRRGAERQELPPQGVLLSACFHCCAV